MGKEATQLQVSAMIQVKAPIMDTLNIAVLYLTHQNYLAFLFRLAVIL